MSQSKLALVLVGALISGCASAPTQVASNGGGGVMSTAAAGGSADVSGDANATGETVSEATVVELKASDPDPATGEVVCREMLQPMSNVIIRRCMTEVDWKKYKREQEFQAREILRRMRGSF